jgi:hypothetical protein
VAIQGAFSPQGKTASLQTNATPSTSNNYQITTANLGLDAKAGFPPQARFVNNGTADIWIVISSVTGIAAAFPTVSAGTAGTPQPGLRLKPGVVEVQTLPGGPNMFISDISGTASQQYDMTVGEGV